MARRPSKAQESDDEGRGREPRPPLSVVNLATATTGSSSEIPAGEGLEAPPPSIRFISRGLQPPPSFGSFQDDPVEAAPGSQRSPSSLPATPLRLPPTSSQRPPLSPRSPTSSQRSGSIPPPSLRTPSNGPFTAVPPASSPTSQIKSTRAPGAESAGATLSDYIIDVLRSLGVDTAFGITGGGLGYFCAALARSNLRVLHCRHESGAVFAAIESYHVNQRPGLVFTTTGPGLTNALTGIAAARRDGAKLIVVSGATAAPQRGRWAFQETSHYTMPASGLFTAGPLFHYAASIEQPVELTEALRRIASGLQKPGGFVAHLSLPLPSQVTGEFDPVSGLPISMVPLRCADATADECAELLKQGPFAIWAGFGARNAWREVRELARRSGAPVMCSPRGKGIFPEDHPQFVGVTGFGGHESVFEYMARARPSYLLVLGTRLGEFTSFWSPDLVPEKGFIHVDVDPEVPGVAYPESTTIGVQADVQSFTQALVNRFRRREAPLQYQPPPPSQPSPPSPRAAAGVRPDYLMYAVQRMIVEKTDVPIITEAGNAFAWGTHALRFSSPGRYRVSTGFGSMGHAVTGVMGMALARDGKAVAIAGDGAMLMNSEVSTAVQYRIPAVWIVLNDSAYGMIHQGMTALGMIPLETAIPPTDFAMIAKGMGADGVRVEREIDLAAAIDRAMAARGPFVVDVVIDPSVKAPAGRRNKSLVDQADKA